MLTPSGMRECATALAVHRNVLSTGLLIYSGAQLATSDTDVFGFGYGRGGITLIVRYDTRVRKATQTRKVMHNGCIH